MNLQELQVISALNIPVKILIINNGMYAVIRKRQKDLFRQRTIGNDSNDGVPVPNFQNIASCFGFEYKLIETQTDLNNLLISLGDDKTQILEIMCVQDQKYFHEAYTLNEKRKLVHRPIEDMSPFLARDLIRNEMIINMMEE